MARLNEDYDSYEDDALAPTSSAHRPRGKSLLRIVFESLAYIDANLATSIAHVYAVQRQLDGATRDATQLMYAKAGDADPRGFLSSMAIYFSDCTVIEPRLLSLYDEILPRIDRSLGVSP